MHIKNSEEKEHSSTKMMFAQQKKEADDTIQRLE